MKISERLIHFSMNRARPIIIAVAILTMLFGALITGIQVDTNPENMLSEQETARVFHNAMKKEFSIHDTIVLGIVNEKDPAGVFNPESLRKVFDLTRYVEGLEGVIRVDLLAPSLVDHIEQAGLGTVRFEWLMPKPPQTREEAIKVRDRARRNPLLDGTLLSEDGKALALYIPIRSKDLSYGISQRLKEKIASFQGDERYFITGLPVAEDTFGVEMFYQMAISAPLAMVVIFLLMLLFFRRAVLILSPLILAFVTVVWTMGFLIGTGNTVHIMSSMIPIFLMPIAVLDSVHILSEFFDRYPKTRDRRATLRAVMDELFLPMLYTSLTTTAGFLSLTLAPIPPVQVFGLFVGFGVMLAWLLTMIFIPAYVVLMSEKALENFGATRHEKMTVLDRLLGWTGNLMYCCTKGTLIVAFILIGVAAYGISQIRVNDNPVKWFAQNHPIRVADRVLNRHFGGTYMAYLVLSEPAGPEEFLKKAAALKESLKNRLEEVASDLPAARTVLPRALRAMDEAVERSSRARRHAMQPFLEELRKHALARSRENKNGWAEAWEEVSFFFDDQKVLAQPFKQPAVLRYIGKLQGALRETEVVGKSNSVADAVKTVHRELLGGHETQFRIPDTPAAVAQTLITYQNSHDPDDLWHLVSQDYTKANIWFQLKSGDNQDMSRVIRATEEFFQRNSPPVPLRYEWAGLTYINVVWQEKMVWGMLNALFGSFLIVFLMMSVLFRSVLWGLLSMVPLSLTIALIYGLIGIAGKDYDMPVAILSSLTLGLSVDFAIHFLQRARVAVRTHGSWEEAAPTMFGEPARAISRNVIVIAAGFTPLLMAPLVPYKTVGIFLSSIMVVSGVGTLIILPALIRTMEHWLFPKEKRPA